MRKWIEASEMWFLRRMFGRISWTRHISKDTKNYVDRHQRKAKKIYRSFDTERRVGTNLNDRKDSRQESKGKVETNDVTIHGIRLYDDNK